MCLHKDQAFCVKPPVCPVMDLGQWCESLLTSAHDVSVEDSNAPCASPSAPVLPVVNPRGAEVQEPESDAAPSGEVINVDGDEEVIELEGGDPGYSPESPRAIPSSMLTRPKVFSLWQCRYAAWQPHLLMPLADFRKSLGHQTLCAILGSLASGVQPEHLFHSVAAIKARVLFTCDPKQTAFQFARRQGFISDHHFVDGRPLAAHGAGPCALHGFRQCSVVGAVNLDLFVAGISCKPYSMARTGRWDGTSHEESFLMDTFFAVLIRHQFKKSILENVFGFLLPESKHEKRSPYQKLLERAARELPNDFVTCYLTNGKTMLVFHRRRVWIVFTRIDCGGAASAKLQTRMIKAIVVLCSNHQVVHRTGM